MTKMCQTFSSNYPFLRFSYFAAVWNILVFTVSFSRNLIQQNTYRRHSWTLSHISLLQKQSEKRIRFHLLPLQNVLWTHLEKRLLRRTRCWWALSILGLQRKWIRTWYHSWDDKWTPIPNHSTRRNGKIALPSIGNDYSVHVYLHFSAYFSTTASSSKFS